MQTQFRTKSYDNKPMKSNTQAVAPTSRTSRTSRESTQAAPPAGCTQSKSKVGTANEVQAAKHIFKRMENEVHQVLAKVQQRFD
jgi:hypothetical protein